MTKIIHKFHTLLFNTQTSLVIILNEILPANPVAEIIITGGCLLLVYRNCDATMYWRRKTEFNFCSQISMDEKKTPTLIYKTGSVILSPSPKKPSESVPLQIHLWGLYKQEISDYIYFFAQSAVLAASLHLGTCSTARSDLLFTYCQSPV